MPSERILTVDAIDVACPECEAGPGDDRFNDGAGTIVHHARDAAANAPRCVWCIDGVIRTTDTICRTCHGTGMVQS